MSINVNRSPVIETPVIFFDAVQCTVPAVIHTDGCGAWSRIRPQPEHWPQVQYRGTVPSSGASQAAPRQAGQGKGATEWARASRMTSTCCLMTDFCKSES